MSHTVRFSLFTWEENWKYQLAVRMEGLDKAIANVNGTSNGVEEISAEQREGIVNYIQRKDILTGYGKSLLFQLLPGICRVLNTMGYTTCPKKAIILVICPLNALIESHMKELQQRNIQICHFIHVLLHVITVGNRWFD